MTARSPYCDVLCDFYGCMRPHECPSVWRNPKRFRAAHPERTIRIVVAALVVSVSFLALRLFAVL